MVMLRAAGLFLVVLGILWALQGAGLIAWPAGSFMLQERDWIWRGGVTTLAGAGLIALAGRRRRR